MTAILQRRYALLLRCYPADYRRSRGDEMLATLVESAAAGQRRPTWREATALVLGGLRARAGTELRRSPRELLLSAAKMTVLALLVYAAAQTVSHLLRESLGRTSGEFVGVDLYLVDFGPDVLVLSLYVLALLSVAADRYVRGALLALAAFLPDTFLFQPWSSGELSAGEFWHVPVAAPLALTLAVFRHTEVTGTIRWLLLVPAAVVLLPTEVSYHWGLQPWAGLTVVAAAVLWMVVDLRVSLAVAGLAVTNVLNAVGWNITAGSGTGAGRIAVDLAIAAMPAAVLLFAAKARNRQETRL